MVKIRVVKQEIPALSEEKVDVPVCEHFRNLVEVLTSPNQDTNNSSSEDENSPTTFSNAEKKMPKKENKKKQADLASQQMINDLKKSLAKRIKSQ